MEHLVLPVLDTQGAQVVGQEVLEIERLPDGRFRLLQSPAFVWGLARGDVIELDPAALSGFLTRSRSGMVAVILALAENEAKATDRVQMLIREVETLGGICEGGPTKALVFSIPVSAGFAAMERAFGEFHRSEAGSSWWYGNVYDERDQPLNWWL